MTKYEVISPPIQKNITGEEEILIKAFGFIRDYKLKARDQQDPRYSFRLSESMDTDTLTPIYSGFKDQGFHDGDYIIFKYRVKGDFNNVKYILQHKLTTEINLEEDKAHIQQEQIKQVPSGKPTNDKGTKELETSSILADKSTTAEIDIKVVQMRTDIMSKLIEYGTKKGEDEIEITARYKRICNLLQIPLS